MEDQPSGGDLGGLVVVVVVVEEGGYDDAGVGDEVGDGVEVDRVVTARAKSSGVSFVARD